MQRALALLLLLLAAPVAEAEGEWPFGGGRGPLSRGKDLYNLGILGAKARDADVEPIAMPQGGGMRRSDPTRGGNDDGPLRLRVELLHPEGPAAKAGLAKGDIITGVGRRAFKEPCLEALATALRKAEAGKGKLTLLVQRAGKTKPERVEISVPSGGKAFSKPAEGAARQAILDRALRWLADRQAAGGGYAQTLSGLNGAVVQASVAGLAWIAGGSHLDAGPYKDNVRRAAEFVIANAGKRGAFGGAAPMRGGRNWDQTNWGVAHAAIFIGELNGHSPKPHLRRALLGMGADLAKRQEESGGWAHGPGGPNALGYVELNIVSGLAIAGLGFAAQAGFDVPEEVLAKADEYLQESSAGDGGIGYSHKPGQRGQGNIGRTAGCWLGYLVLDRGKSGWGQKMKRWVGRGAGRIFGGHASLMQHILLGGVAAHAHGGKAESAYWKAALRELTLARAPDGSLQPRPWRESLSMGSNSDVSFGEVWTTAAWAIVLGCEPVKGGRPGLPYWMGLKRGGS